MASAARPFSSARGTAPAVIHWFRRDLRISDNTSLYAAWSRAECLVPAFIWDNAILPSPEMGPAQVSFLLRSLEALGKNLAALGHRLIIRHGPSATELGRLARETSATAVFTNREYEPDAVARDRTVATDLYRAGVYFESFKDSVIWETREILTRAGEPYTVFTPYAKAWRARPPSSPVARLGPAKIPLDPNLPSVPLPADSAAVGQPLHQTLPRAGEQAGQAALKQFLRHSVFEYAEARNRPAWEGGTSGLSPHLHFGTVSIRTLLHRLRAASATAPSAAAQRGVAVWETELIWREFYRQILANFPHVARGSFRPEYDGLNWSGTEEQFEAWCAGRTGYPIVDAAMRCLNATAWMHNRLRMVVAMFLTKDLLVSWQRGERLFRRQLVDGDLAANNGGWQWSAGTGTDAAPYFRIFNPVSQGERFDPEGAFVRRWIPELAGADPRLIHRPWEDPLWLKHSGYPPPIVDHRERRELCLAMFQAVKGR